MHMTTLLKLSYPRPTSGTELSWLKPFVLARMSLNYLLVTSRWSPSVYIATSGPLDGTIDGALIPPEPDGDEQDTDESEDGDHVANTSHDATEDGEESASDEENSEGSAGSGREDEDHDDKKMRPTPKSTTTIRMKASNVIMSISQSAETSCAISLCHSITHFYRSARREELQRNHIVDAVRSGRIGPDGSFWFDVTTSLTYMLSLAHVAGVRIRRISTIRDLVFTSDFTGLV